MKNSTASLGLMVIVAVSVVSPARAAAEARLVVPESGLVLDGGDLEAAPITAAAWIDTSAAPVPAAGPVAASLAALDVQPAPAPAPRPVAFEYSDGYYTRLKIDKWASFPTLPLFATEAVLGQKLYNGTASDSTTLRAQGDCRRHRQPVRGEHRHRRLEHRWRARKDPNRQDEGEGPRDPDARSPTPGSPSPASPPPHTDTTAASSSSRARAG